MSTTGIVATFPLGTIVVTRNAAEKLQPGDYLAGLKRHAERDWGDVSDPEENNQALAKGQQLLSVYHDSKGVKYWIITEWDRSVTTVLLPEDY